MEQESEGARHRRVTWPRLAFLAALVTYLCFATPAGTALAATEAASTPVPPVILSSHATKTSLGPAGGSLQVKATVKHAQTCRLELLWQPPVEVVYSHNPTTACHGDNYSANVTVGPNPTGAVRTIGFKLVVRNATSATSQSLYVSISPKKTSPTSGNTKPPAAGTATTAPAPPSSITKLTTTTPVSDVQSSNWSGYTAYGGPFTGVTGTFTVPSVSGAFGNEVTSEWVGIDGAQDTSLIQAGVLEQTGPGPAGSVEVLPWWEILPAAETPITSVTVTAGDSVTVSIWRVSDATWEIELVDNTDGQHFATKQTYSGPGQSAEWVLEAPTNGNNDRVTALAPFSPAVTFSSLGTAGPVTSLEQDSMVQGNQEVAIPTTLTTGGFKVAYTSMPDYGYRETNLASVVH